MSNTLTGLIPDLYEAMDVVSREAVGFIPAVTNMHSAERAAVGENVTSFVTPAQAATDITPGVTPPNDGDQTIGNIPIQITKARRVPFRWNGEEQKGVNNGSGYKNIRTDQIAQAIRTLTNEMEADLWALHLQTSRAVGTAGTTPFASDISATALARQVLLDNGAPMSDLQMVIDSSAGAKLRSMSNLIKANEAATDAGLRRGVLLDINGFAMRESAAIGTFTKGTNNGSASTNTAGYAVGARTITLASAGTGTILAGDVITFAGDTNQYVVETGDSDVSNGGTIVLAAPGLRKAIAASATVITTVNTATRNLFFRRSAFALACRAPALPEEGDMALDRINITDPISGMTFELSMYAQYRQIQYELAVAWGVKCFKKEHSGILLG